MCATPSFAHHYPNHLGIHLPADCPHNPWACSSNASRPPAGYPGLCGGPETHSYPLPALLPRVGCVEATTPSRSKTPRSHCLFGAYSAPFGVVSRAEHPPPAACLGSCCQATQAVLLQSCPQCWALRASVLAIHADCHAAAIVGCRALAMDKAAAVGCVHL